MPVYTLDLAIPANTAEASPTKKELEIEGAILDKLHVLIPEGHAALARLAIFYGIRQIFPHEAGTWLRGNDESIGFRLNWPLPEPKTTITFKGWNEDDTYDHVFYCRLEVTERVEEARPWRVLADLVAIIRKLIGL